MRWLGLDWDEGPEVGGAHAPYFQSQRYNRHRDCGEAARIRARVQVLLLPRFAEAETRGGGAPAYTVEIRSHVSDVVRGRTPAHGVVGPAARGSLSGADGEDVVCGRRARTNRVRPRAD